MRRKGVIPLILFVAFTAAAMIFTVVANNSPLLGLALQGGVTAALGSAEIPVGTYTQLRLIVDSAQVTLKAPITFTSGSQCSVALVDCTANDAADRWS